MAGCNLARVRIIDKCDPVPSLGNCESRTLSKVLGWRAAEFGFEGRGSDNFKDVQFDNLQPGLTDKVPYTGIGSQPVERLAHHFGSYLPAEIGRNQLKIIKATRACKVSKARGVQNERATHSRDSTG